MVDLFQVNCEEIALEQGKTIKEIAEELGVSKTAVRKQIANLGLQTNRKPVCDWFPCGHHEPCRIPHKPCSIGVLCRAYKGGNPYQSSFTADTGTYRLCADKVVCKRVYEVERILLN